ncbi:hypothetical protein KUV65_15795 [Maritalea mobilis]|nr:hypothetical protein [Maritalea mobilis]MBY6202837.1 hypothetical protein [Maritalea mobilis]
MAADFGRRLEQAAPFLFLFPVYALWCLTASLAKPDPVKMPDSESLKPKN